MYAVAEGTGDIVSGDTTCTSTSALTDVRLETMGARMHRTQVYRPEALNSALDELARQQGTSKADLMRRAAQRLVGEETPVESDPPWGIVALGSGGPGYAAENHDRYLAEAEVARWKRRAG